MAIVKAGINPGTFIVLEGLDGTGKSTQIEKFKESLHKGMWGHDLMLTHQPSGGNAVGIVVYEFLENHELDSALARQFLHLASHAEHYARSIIPSLEEGVPVIMDRCWWSTLAYGYSGVKAECGAGFTWEDFKRLAKLPAQGHMPDVVFLFDTPWVEDAHNKPEVVTGYQRLADEHPEVVVRVPQLSQDETFVHILFALADRELTS